MLVVANSNGAFGKSNKAKNAHFQGRSVTFAIDGMNPAALAY
jgi:hypothetical protein